MFPAIGAAAVALLLIFCIHVPVRAQYPISYSFSYFTYETAYTELTGDTSINKGESWYNYEVNWRIPLPFSFKVFDKTTDTIYMITPAMLSDKPDSGIASQEHNFIVPQGFVCDKGWYRFYYFHIADTAYLDTATHVPSLSPLSYKTEGIAPNRVMKIQIKNAGIASDSTDSDFVNLQIWLYEGTNVIEYRYGPSRILPETFGPGGGPLAWLLNNAVFNWSSNTERDFVTVGNADSPHLKYCWADTVNFYTEVFHLTGIPPLNMVYRYTPYHDTSGNIVDTTVIDLTAVKEVAAGNSHFTVVPNPATDYVSVGHSGINTGTVALYSLSGVLIWQKDLASAGNINIADLPAGVYLLRIISPGLASFTTRVVKL